MSLDFSHTSVVRGIGSGAGALKVGSVADQLGNLLGIDPTVMTPIKNVGSQRQPGGAIKKRFGSTGVDGMFNYPQLAVPGTGNGQAYRASRPGYLPGNDGGGQAGFGVGNPHDSTYMPATDLSVAQGIAMREADIMPHFVQPEHFMYTDKTKLDMIERLTDMTEDYQRERIKKLYSQGFTEEEVRRYVEKEREKQIEQAEKMPYNRSELLEATLARAMPTELREDYGNQSVAPGLIPRRQDMAAAERAANGVGNVVAMKKKMESVRHEQKLRGELDKVEPEVPGDPEPILDMLKRLSKEAGAEMKKGHAKHVEAHRKDQMGKAEVVQKQKEAIKKVIPLKEDVMPSGIVKQSGQELANRIFGLSS